MFKPFVFGAAAPDFGPAPSDRADPGSRWWCHEAMHRAAVGDFTAALAQIAPERDALEARFQARMDAAGGAPDEAIALCWREADEAEARWRAMVGGRAVEPLAHRRSWARLSQAAGLRT